MKKKSKILSIFIMLFAIIFELFMGAKTKIIAENGGAPILNDKIFYESKDTTVNGNVKITPQGEISISYQYGFTELLVKVHKCDKYNADLIEDATACDVFSSTSFKIIHLSGSYVENPTNSSFQTKKIHLFNQDFLDYDEIVKIEVYTEFLKSSSKPVALYCNPDAGFECLTEENEEGVPSSESIMKRFNVSLSDIEFQDKSALIYKGDDTTPVSSPLSVGKFSGETSIRSIDSETVVKVDNSKFASDDELTNIINDSVIPVLIAVLLIAAGVSITVLGYQIVKSADEAQERHEKVVRLRNILIGIGIAVLLLAAVGPLSDVIEKILFKD